MHEGGPRSMLVAGEARPSVDRRSERTSCRGSARRWIAKQRRQVLRDWRLSFCVRLDAPLRARLRFHRRPCAELQLASPSGSPCESVRDRSPQALVTANSARRQPPRPRTVHCPPELWLGAPCSFRLHCSALGLEQCARGQRAADGENQRCVGCEGGGRETRLAFGCKRRDEARRGDAADRAVLSLVSPQWPLRLHWRRRHACKAAFSFDAAMRRGAAGRSIASATGCSPRGSASDRSDMRTAHDERSGANDGRQTSAQSNATPPPQRSPHRTGTAHTQVAGTRC